MDNQNTTICVLLCILATILILVLMDNQNTERNLFLHGTKKRLNPCSNG